MTDKDAWANNETQPAGLNSIPLPSSPSGIFSYALIHSLIRLGVIDIVVTPGSRSQALALTAVEAQLAGKVHTHIRIDERSASFFALGLSRESRQPTVVITTSGTAVANTHPAVLEAHHSGVPIIILSADRPAEMRGIRSNQTTVQAGIFVKAVRYEEDIPAPSGRGGEVGIAARIAARAVGAARGDSSAGTASFPGPVHLNLQLREPLFGVIEDETEVPDPKIEIQPGADGGASIVPKTLALKRGPNTLVIAGADAGPSAETLARTAGWPLIAEITSGAHFGPNLIVAYREMLSESGFRNKVERVIVFGHPTLSREVPDLVQTDGVEAIVVAASGIEWYNPGRRVRRFERSVRVDDTPITEAETKWLQVWVNTSRAVLETSEPEELPLRDGIDETGHVRDFRAQREYTRAQLLSLHEPITRDVLTRAVWNATWPHDRLILGASRLIRELDKIAGGRRITAIANRGLSGIDGTVATALGVAVASQRRLDTAAAGITRALIGDITFLHDVGSMLWGVGENLPRAQIIVGNDGGGTIFDTLPAANSTPPHLHDRAMLTPQTVDFEALAKAYSWGYTKVATRIELNDALGTQINGLHIVDVSLAR